MKLPTQNVLAWEGAFFSIPLHSSSTHIWDFRKVCVTILHLFVIGVTSVRLVHRWRTKRMWWDDYGAFVTLIVDVLVVILMWLKFRHGGKKSFFVSEQD